MSTKAGTAYVDVEGQFGKFQEGVKQHVGEATGTFTKAFGGIAAAVGGVFAVQKVGDLFKDSIAEARESVKVTALTNQVITSTGGAAKVTADQIGDLANAISLKSGIDDEAIQSGENLLLTFTNIRNETGKGNDIFNQSTQAVTDLSVALGQDMKSSAIQVGKALNDPIRGVTALQRVGVSFTEQQKEQIKTLVASGDTLGAQKIILGELNKEFGGAAKAAADPLAKLGVVFKNLEERVGLALLPVINKVADFLGDRLPGAVTKAGEAINAISNGFNRLREFLAPVLDPIISFFQHDPDARFAALAVIIGGVAVTAVIALGSAMAAAFSPIYLVVAAIAAVAFGVIYAYRHFETFRNIVDAVGRFFRDQVGPALVAVGRFLRDDVAPALAVVGRFIVDTIIPALAGFVGGVIDVTGAIVRFLSDFPDNLISAFFDGAAAAGRFFERLPGLAVEGLKQLGHLLVKGAIEAIGLWLAALITEATLVVLFFKNLPENLLKVLVFAAKLQAKGAEMIADVIAGAAGKVPELIRFVASLPGRIAAALIDLGRISGQKGIEFTVALEKGAVDRLPGLLGFVVSLPGRIITALGSLAGKLTSAGVDLIEGMIKGILSAAPRLLSAIKDSITDKLPQFVKDRLGIKSPSVVFAEIGHNVALGMAEGITGSSHLVQAAAGQLLPTSSTVTSSLPGGGPGGGPDGGQSVSIHVDAPLDQEILRKIEYGARVASWQLAPTGRP